MFSINLKRSVAALAVTAGLLAAAAPAHAGTPIVPDGELSLAFGVTMLDYEGTPIVTYSLKHSSRGDDRVGATGLKSDSNEVAVEGLTQIREPQRVMIDLVEELGADS